MISKIRKRKTSGDSPPPIDAESAQSIFQRHFEAQFRPLSPPPQAKVAEVESEDEEEEDSEWGGLSDDEDAGRVQVVDHTGPAPQSSLAMSKREMKDFMSSRPPSSSEPVQTPRRRRTSNSSDEDSTTLLKHDIALQRLIAESHLLHAEASKTATAANPFSHSRTAVRTQDLRVRAANPKAPSLLDQPNVPMAIRKGIRSAKIRREDRRRTEARESGIVLERKGGAKRQRQKRGRREVAVDMPGIGRMHGAELRLSENDIRSMEGGGGGKGRRDMGFRGKIR